MQDGVQWGYSLHQCEFKKRRGTRGRKPILSPVAKHALNRAAGRPGSTSKSLTEVIGNAISHCTVLRILRESAIKKYKTYEIVISNQRRMQKEIREVR